MKAYSKNELIKVAKLHHLAGLSQEEVASFIGLSRSSVSRMLTQAKKQGIIKISIVEQGDFHEDLQRQIIERFGISTAIVIPSADQEFMKARIGQAAAEYLRDSLSDNMLVGIQWGTTANYMIEAYEGRSAAKNVEIMQISGGMHISNTIVGGIETIKKLATKMEVDYHILHYPLIVNSETLAKMVVEDENREYFERMNDIDMVFLGLGSNNPEEISAYLGGYISLNEAAEFMEQGLTAEVCGHRLNPDGTLAGTVFDGRMITIPLETIRKIPLRVGVAVGTRKKESILAAIRGGYLNVLIIDDICALAILGENP